MFEWKILDITVSNNIITSAKYHCVATDKKNTVETEGNWYFSDGAKHPIEFDQVTEQMVIDWINQEAIRDGKNLITSRLKEQLATLQDQTPVVAPWLPQVYTPKI
jgi:hypothetical protein